MPSSIVSDEPLTHAGVGRARGQQLSNDRKPETASTSTTAGWLLRHPSDHYFSKALEVVSDPLLRTALSEWVLLWVELLGVGDTRLEHRTITYGPARRSPTSPTHPSRIGPSRRRDGSQLI